MTRENDMSDYEAVEYDHRRVRAALDRAMLKYPAEERYQRMIWGVEELLRRATENNAIHAIAFQSQCLHALKRDNG
jgi:hypothetical protein